MIWDEFWTCVAGLHIDGYERLGGHTLVELNTLSFWLTFRCLWKRVRGWAKIDVQTKLPHANNSQQHCSVSTHLELLFHNWSPLMKDALQLNWPRHRWPFHSYTLVQSCSVETRFHFSPRSNAGRAWHIKIRNSKGQNLRLQNPCREECKDPRSVSQYSLCRKTRPFGHNS